MKSVTMFLRQKKAIAAIVIAVTLAAICPPASAQESAAGPDVIVTITRLAETLDLIDRLAGESREPGKPSPTAIVRGSLMGTHWIDPARPIVVGVNFSNGVSAATALVPFKQPNPDFQSAYNAKPGPDYYVLALPQNPDRPLTDGDEAVLLAAAAFPQEKLVSVKVSLGRLLAANSDKIDQMIAGIDAGRTPEEEPASPVSPEEVRRMLRSSLALLRQIDTLKLDFDFNQETLSLGYEVAAAADTRLAEAFVSAGETSLLAGLPLEEQIVFRSRAYNLPRMLDLVGQAFGDLYRKMGIDFAGLQKISRAFTGEMLGGMSLGEDRLDFGFMAVLDENIPAGDFLEKEYLPWLLEYGRQISALAEKASGEKAAEPVSITAESTVGGRRVLGCRIEMPMAAFPGPAGPIPARLPIDAYDMRMTTTGQILAVASDDARLAELLERAEKLTVQPATGPLMTGEIDLGGYLAAVKSLVQQDAGDLPPLPTLGRMLFQGDMGEGRASFDMSMRLKDIQGLIAYAAAFAPSAGAAGGSAVGQPPEDEDGGQAQGRSDRAGREPPEAEPEPGTLKVPPKKEAVAVKKDAEYWTTRAYLCTTYGNDKAAIQFFKKAIALSPGSSNLHFQMGISYAELGYYQAALAAIDKAISLGGDKALYHYGRGRVLLQSGKDAEGMADIRKAAEMGDLDAIQYLEGANPKPVAR
jgi:Flp pilus assembly protein TadD